MTCSLGLSWPLEWDAEDLTAFSSVLLRLQGIFAFTCLRPCERQQDICSVPIATEKQSWP